MKNLIIPTIERHEGMRIEKTNSSYGNWVIRTSDATFKFFWTKKDAKNWLSQTA